MISHTNCNENAHIFSALDIQPTRNILITSRVRRLALVLEQGPSVIYALEIY